MTSRRTLLAGGLAWSGVALRARAAEKWKVLVTGAHPGDPECGCAGTIARYVDAGHEVAICYLNRGEGYCGRNELSQCASIRTVEAEAACRMMKARPIFLGQIDGQAVVDDAHFVEVRKLLVREKPDVIFAHWPIDTHRDHRAISSLLLDAWLAGDRKAVLYFYEVAGDTQMFKPAQFVDISAVEDRRHAACYAHVSQSPDKWYPKQVELTRAHGKERGVQQADGFIRHELCDRDRLPG